MKVVVVGAGSIGAHIAYRLSEQGAEVVLVEAGSPASGTSSSSFAWLSSFPQVSWAEEPGRAALRRAVHRRFHELSEELGGDWVHWAGTLTWGSAAEREGLRSAYEQCRAAGLDLDLIDAEGLRSFSPTAVVADDDEFIWESDAGWVDAPQLVGLLVDRLRMTGGTVLGDTRVVAVDRAAGRVRGVTISTGDRIEADAVVNATGSWGSHLAALAGETVPLELVPGLMVYSEPLPAGSFPSQVLNSPTWLARPDPSGGLAIHWRGEQMTSVHGANGNSAQGIIDRVAETIPALRGTAPLRTSVGIRPIPPGGPVIGSLPWLDGFYFALSHGGIGWGPVWADVAARELLHGETVPELRNMRPERFYLESSAFGRYADDAEQARSEVEVEV